MSTPGAFDFGERFRARMQSGKIIALCGVHDAFSARLAAERFEGVFCSGFSFAASKYGLPDIGFVTWTDIADFAARVRHVIGSKHLLVDVDDGFGDQVVAANSVRQIEACGGSAVMLEDQRRPRRCGHFEGKDILPVEEYLQKLELVLQSRQQIFVIARTDANRVEEGIERAVAYAQAGADAVMVEAIEDLGVLERLASQVDVPIMVNQLFGGKSPNWSLPELESAGAKIVIYSTPTLFSAQFAMERYLDSLVSQQRLTAENTASMSDCSQVLKI